MGVNFDVNDKRFVSLALIGGGLLLLAFWNFGIGIVWPMFVVGPGAIMLYHALNARTTSDLDMIFPGTIVSATGLVLLYQSISGNWASWAYIWAIYPVLTGFAMQWRAVRVPKYSAEYEVGQNMLRYGLMALIGMAVIFEFAIFRSTGAQMIGLAALGLGLLLLFSGKNEKNELDFSELTGKRKHGEKDKFREDDAA